MSAHYDTAAVAKHFSRAAFTYDAHATIQQPYIARAVDVLQKQLIKQACVLDAGCGTGAFGRIAREQGVSWRVVGCDIAADMCRVASQQQFITLRANIEQLPLKESSMDAALCAFALQWGNKPNEVITSLARTLKPHAPLLLYSFSEGTLHELRDATRHAGMQHIVSSFHPAERYAEWAEAAGLQIIEFSEQTHTQYFAHVDEIFSTLKHMGATNSLSQRSKGLGSRERLKNLTSSYQQLFTSSNGIPVSWKVVSVIAKRV